MYTKGKVRIVLIGQAAFGARMLEVLVERGEEVVGAFTPLGERGELVKQAAEKARVALFQPPRMRLPQVYDDMVGLAPDLGVMAFVTDIIPPAVLRLPRLGTIQYHPSLLPRHRGGSAINWAIIQGETRTGLTIFWPDEGIDTGPILLQREVELSPEDTVGSLYFNKLFPLGVEAIVEAVQLIQDEKAPRLPQDESHATYEGLCTEKEAIIDWAKPVSQVYNLIRGTNPQPGAATWWRGKKLKVFDCAKLPTNYQALPGEIVELTPEGWVVAASGGAILVKRVQPQGSPKIKAVELASAQGLKVGERLGHG